MTGYLAYALADSHIDDLLSRAGNSRRVTKRSRRSPRRPLLGGARRLRRAFG